MHKKTNSHNYQKKLDLLIESGKLKDIDVANLNISHDDWCEVDNGGFCNCDPDVVIMPFTNN